MGYRMRLGVFVTEATEGEPPAGHTTTSNFESVCANICIRADLAHDRQLGSVDYLMGFRDVEQTPQRPGSAVNIQHGDKRLQRRRCCAVSPASWTNLS